MTSAVNFSQPEPGGVCAGCPSCGADARHAAVTRGAAVGPAAGADRGPECPSRRVVLAAGVGGVVVLLAGCQTYGAESAPPVPVPGSSSGGLGSSGGPASGDVEASGGAADGAAADGAAAGGDDAAGGDSGGAGQPAGEVLANLSDIPVGGGVVFADKGVVVTCPKEGTVKAFSVTCPHAGCAVNQVTGGTINCPCHGSKFRVADGSVAAGPAARPLAPVKVDVDGDSITLA